MGSNDFYSCSCGYSTACARGVDRGFDIQVTSMECKTCKEVLNVITGNYISLKLAPLDPVCPLCKRSEGLSPWRGRRCPKCQAVMSFSPCVDMWD